MTHEQVQHIIDKSDRLLAISISQKILKETLEADLTMGISGGIFTVSESLVSFVQTLIDKKKVKNVVLIDNNKNPIMINDLEDFQNSILDRYFTAVSKYHAEYSELIKTYNNERSDTFRSIVDRLNDV